MGKGRAIRRGGRAVAGKEGSCGKGGQSPSKEGGRAVGE